MTISASRKKSLCQLALVCFLGLAVFACEQATAQIVTVAPLAATAPTPIPALVPYAGTLPGSELKPASVTFLIYTNQLGGDALWAETQSVVADESGKYRVQLGATLAHGLPASLFSAGDARWLEVQVAGEKPQPRTLLTSVPYAFKAADAEALAGRAASDYVTQEELQSAAAASPAFAAANLQPAPVQPNISGTGTANYLPIWTNSTTFGNSALYQTNGRVGVGTTSPGSTLDVYGSATVRGVLGLPAVGTATASAGDASQALQFTASAYSSSTKAAVAQNFRWEALPVSNNTSGPSANLSLFYAAGAATPVATGLSIAPNGKINFASSQTFGAASSSGIAFNGTSTSSVGVEGKSTTGSGVVGDTAGSTLNTAGVIGAAGTRNTSGYGGIAGIWGDASQHVGVLGTSDQYAGVQGISNAGPGVQGQSSTTFGVTGSTSSGVAGIYGTYGNISGINYTNAGVWGDSQFSTGLLGTSYGSYGVVGYSTGSVGGLFFGGPDAQGVYSYGGSNSDTSEAGAGGQFYGGNANGGGTGGDGGVFIGGNGTAGYNDTQGGDAIYAYPGVGENSTYAYAGLFSGNVVIEGSISNAAQRMQIDNPTDPANKYLVHSAVQSSEQMNIYSGNVTTDEFGVAIVALPDWFESLNTDFRYQLTVIGQFAQAIIKDKIANKKFTIMTNAQHVEVSWQVTAIRQDAYAKAHPLVVEEAKPARERGFYMHPEIFGQPQEKQTQWARRPQLMARLKARRERPGGLTASGTKAAATPPAVSPGR